MSQRKLNTLFKLKSDTQQPTPDKDKGDRDINVSEAISEGPSSVASASAISKHGPPYIDAAGITLSNLSHKDQLNQLEAEWTDAHTFTFPSR
jgi:hypothetical protein